MAAKKQTAAPAGAGEQAEAPRKRGKLVLIISMATLVLAGGGAGAYFAMKPKDADAALVEAPKPSVFLPLEAFTVNLLPDNGQPQYIQAGLTLKLDDEHTSTTIKDRMPEVRDRILMVLSGKRGAELLPTEGKQKLATEIATAVKSVIEPPKPARKPARSVEEEQTAEAGEGAEAEGEKPAPKRRAHKGPRVEVLFTAFIVQ